MAAGLIKFVLKPGKEQSLLRFHPWIFSGAIAKKYGDPKEGELVSVYSHRDEFLGIGHFQIGSIAVRILTFQEEEIDFTFWKNKVESAWKLRKTIGLAENPETNVFRLIHGEGDGMPGLIVDYYNGTVVMQAHSIGMYLVREQLVEAFREVLGDSLKAIYNKSDKTMPFKAEVKSEDGFIYGKDTGNEVLEYGLKFRVDWEEGQKTGFFVDQRENRRLVQTYSNGREVLNMFCYTGGFSFYSLKGGAKSVHSVDASAKAIELTRENVELNFPGDKRHEAFTSDVFKFMKDIRDRYDLIILDPPAFAKHRNALPQALKGYKRINTRAFEQIRNGGILFTFSCSQVVSKERFREAVFSAAAIAGRKVRILHQLDQPADHPVNIYHPEGEYLKGLVLYVE